MTNWSEQSDVVVQVVGMVSVQAECDHREAFTRIRERAESMDSPVEEIALAVIERRMRFAPRSD
jgi:AmiR/NasT family two-component response regulator